MATQFKTSLVDTERGVGGKIDRNLSKVDQSAVSTALETAPTTPPAQSAITSQSLTPTQSFNLTPAQPSTAADGFAGYMGASATQLSQQRQQMQESKDDYLTTILKGDTETGLQDKLYAKQVDPAEAELNDINQQIIASQHAQQREVEQLGKSAALTPAQFEAQRAGINRKYTYEQADLAVIQLSKQGKFDSAKRIADRAVTAMMERQKMVTEALRFNYQENKDLFDKNEQRLFETAQSERERTLQNEEYRLRAEFDQKIQQNDPLYQLKIQAEKASIANTYSQINERNNKSASLGGTLNGKPQTTTQATIQGYAQRVTESNKIISQIGSKFTGALSVIGQMNPFNILKSSERQQYEQAQRNYVNAVLRRESGAVISDEEFANARQQYFPQPGDQWQVVAQKAVNRTSVEANLYQAANVPQPVEPGTVIKGYKVVGRQQSFIAPVEQQDNRDLLAKSADFAEKYIPGAQIGKALGNSVGGIVDSFKQGSIKPLLEAGDRNNANYSRVVGDVVQSVATPASLAVSAPASLAGRVAQGVGIGATLSGANSSAKGGDAGDIAKSAALGGAIGGALPLAGAGVRQLGKLLGKTGDKIQFSVIKPSQADIKDGFKIETVKKFNLGGSLKSTFEKTDQTIDDLSKQLNAKLAGSNSTLDLSKAYENTAKRLLGNKFEQFGANSAVEKTLEQLRGEIASVGGPNGLVSVMEAQTVKRAAGHFGAWSYGAPTVEATAQQKVYNTFYNEMKTAIEKASPEGVREINKKISELIPVMNALIRRIPVAERNSALSLTDVITMSAATLEPRALALTLANLVSKSGTAGAALSKLGGRIANPTTQTVGNVLRTGITSQLGSSTPEPQTSQLSPGVSSPQSSTLSPEQQAAVRRGVEIGKMVDPTGAVGSVAKVGGKAASEVIKSLFKKEMPYGLLKNMEEFIDYVRIKKLPKDYGKGGAPDFEADFRDALTKFDPDVAKLSNGQLAGFLDELLARAKELPVQLRDDLGRFSGSK